MWPFLYSFNFQTKTSDNKKHESEEQEKKASDHVTSHGHMTGADHVTEDLSEAGTLSEEKRENTSSSVFTKWQTDNLMKKNVN